MAVSERDRHELYRKLEGALGKEPADTMMALLPPVGWADVATKDDLRNLEERLILRMENLESRMDAMESRLVGRMEADLGRVNQRMLKLALAVNIPTILGTAALVLAAARLG
ncbi:MAG TPA: hypothetical protein VHL78_04135 [Actinomycetota bacterium]|nr:hypothetical protein [Actinomycetota bacterium]